ncbi:MAG TPA: hypothetical protein VF079_05310 [Sphingomicrobium sp.]
MAGADAIATIEGYAVLVGIPALIGLMLPRPFRLAGGIVAVIAAIVLWMRGLNIHGVSAALFFVLGSIGIGALLRECAAQGVRLIRRSRKQSIREMA